MKNYKNVNWNLDSSDATFESCSLAVLMDIREELRTLRQIFKCTNFQRIPRKLDRISANTYRPKKKRKVKTTATP
jgi:hypothetical protein